jgi:hypothetical protein
LNFWRQTKKMSDKSSAQNKRLASCPIAANFTLPSHPTFCCGNLVDKLVRLLINPVTSAANEIFDL